MDTSKKYVEMCERAREILKEWVPQNGDFVWHPDEGAEHMGTWEFPEKFDIVSLSDNDKDWWYNWFWLPRQDQLQEMIIADEGCKGKDRVYWKINWFWEFVQDTCFISSCVIPIPILTGGENSGDYTDKAFPTMEQLWLAFVMREEYQKEWSTTKKDWIAQQEE